MKTGLKIASLVTIMVGSAVGDNTEMENLEILGGINLNTAAHHGTPPRAMYLKGLYHKNSKMDRGLKKVDLHC